MNERVQVAILGPTRIDRVAGAAGFDPARIRAVASAIGAEVARRDWTLVVVPDRGVAVAAMDGYLAAGGAEIIGITPVGGASDPAGAVAIAEQSARCTTLLSDLTWYEQHHRIGVESDAMVAVGMSCGTMAELVWTKWNDAAPPVAYIDDLATALPPELAAELEISPVSAEAIGAWLDAHTRSTASVA